MGFTKQYFIDRFPVLTCSLGDYYQIRPCEAGNDGDYAVLASDVPETDDGTDVLPFRIIMPTVRV